MAGSWDMWFGAVPTAPVAEVARRAPAAGESVDRLTHMLTFACVHWTQAHADAFLRDGSRPESMTRDEYIAFLRYYGPEEMRAFARLRAMFEEVADERGRTHTHTHMSPPAQPQTRLVLQPWFHGYADRDVISRVMAGSRVLSFTVRYSATAVNSFGVSQMLESGIKHVLIEHTPTGYSVNPHAGGAVYDTVTQVINAERASLMHPIRSMLSKLSEHVLFNGPVCVRTSAGASAAPPGQIYTSVVFPPSGASPLPRPPAVSHGHSKTAPEQVHESLLSGGYPRAAHPLGRAPSLPAEVSGFNDPARMGGVGYVPGAASAWPGGASHPTPTAAVAAPRHDAAAAPAGWPAHLPSGYPTSSGSPAGWPGSGPTPSPSAFLPTHTGVGGTAGAAATEAAKSIPQDSRSVAAASRCYAHLGGIAKNILRTLAEGVPACLAEEGDLTLIASGEYLVAKKLTLKAAANAHIDRAKPLFDGRNFLPAAQHYASAALLAVAADDAKLVTRAMINVASALTSESELRQAKARALPLPPDSPDASLLAASRGLYLSEHGLLKDAAECGKTATAYSFGVSVPDERYYLQSAIFNTLFRAYQLQNDKMNAHSVAVQHLKLAESSSMSADRIAKLRERVDTTRL